YTNSSHLPVSYSADVFSALDVQDELQTLYTSGTVFHTFLGEKLPDWQSTANLVKKIAENYRLPYYTMSPTYSVCKDHGYLAGENFTCPICGQPAEVYSRITGYYRPIQNWNDGKRAEYKDRLEYDIATSKLTHTGPVNKTYNLSANPDVLQDEVKDSVVLFAKKTCPNCKMVALKMDKAGISYDKVICDDGTKESAQMAIDNNIQTCPVLIVTKDGKSTRYENASDISKFIEDNK
ncbi:MAG: ribonucleoside triphosphate reductase, partial [Clostridia bacterium]|nr:ribonucleoside triphosphate reductase [Clostridia bacterium]